jgi:hypothetical protein
MNPISIKEYGLAIKEGWSWLLYLIAFFLWCHLFGSDTALLLEAIKHIVKRLNK